MESRLFTLWCAGKSRNCGRHYDLVVSALFRNPHLLSSVVVDAAGMQHKVTEGFKAQDEPSFYPAEFNVVDIAPCENSRGINGMFWHLGGEPVLPTNKLKDQLRGTVRLDQCSAIAVVTPNNNCFYCIFVHLCYFPSCS